MTVARELIESPDYWRGINPDSNVTETPWPAECNEIEFSAAEIEACKESLAEEGYFQTRPCIADASLERLINCIKRVRDERHPPAYALLYDDFFEVLASIAGLLRQILGSDFLIVPDEPDVYLIRTANDEGGAVPHRDTLRAHDMYDENGLPAMINIWIPITDATNLNSCMHVIPAHADPDFGTPRSDGDLPESMPTEILQNVRALPAKAGSVLGWSTELIHWGGASSTLAGLPRLSFAMYFQRADAERFHPTAMPVPFELDFDYRLYLVEKVFRDPYGKELPSFI